MNLKILGASSHVDDHELEQVAKILSSTKSPRVRNAAALAIGDLKYTPGIPALTGQLSRPETRGFRGTILYALECLEAKVPALILAHIIINGGYEAQAGALDVLNANLDCYNKDEVAEALGYATNDLGLNKTEPVEELYEVLVHAAAQFPDDRLGL